MIPMEIDEMGKNNSQDLKDQIELLESQLADLQARLPAHSIPPNLITELDELDEQLREAKSRLEEMEMGRD
jgi:chromosome segregation ATPase